MRALQFVACVLVAGLAGYLLGSRDGGGRSREQVEHRRPRPARRLIEIPADDLVRIHERVARTDALEAENERLRKRLTRLGPVAREEGELPAGSRRRAAAGRTARSSAAPAGRR